MVKRFSAFHFPEGISYLLSFNLINLDEYDSLIKATSVFTYYFTFCYIAPNTAPPTIVACEVFLLSPALTQTRGKRRTTQATSKEEGGLT